ncbi:hypothetical protein Q7P36_003461 [Cladosporium allicinum]
MRLSSAATGLALVAIATASTQSNIVSTQSELIVTKAAAKSLAHNSKSTIKPEGLPKAFKESALQFDRAVKDVKENKRITTDCDSAATEYNVLSDLVSKLTPDMVSLGCDVRITSKVREDVSGNVQQLVKSINTLEPYFEEYCPDQSVFPSQTETITSNLDMIVDAFEQPCDA